MSAEQPSRRPTRADVARLAEVSPAVVSYVLSGSHPVSTATRARVLAAIESLGYRRNATARALRRGRSDSVGLVLADIGNPHFMEFARAIESHLAAHDQALLIAEQRHDVRADRSAVQQMIARGVDALLLTTGVEDAEAEASIPTILLDRAAPHPRFVTIGTDAGRATVDAVSHLIEQHGHASVALVTGPGAGLDGREAGWRQAHASLMRSPGPLVRTDWTREGGHRAARALLQGPDRPSAILAASDLIAVGLLRAALDAHVAVPDELAVISYDGTHEARYTAPRLTTIEQPREAMAALAVELLLGGDLPPAHHAFPAPLVLRRSCGCRHDELENRRAF